MLSEQLVRKVYDMTDKMQVEQVVVGPVSTNCYIVIHKDTKEAFVVDPGDYGEGLAAQLDKLGAKPEGILLTHGHFDHAGAAEDLAKKYDIPVYAHMKEQETLENPMVNLSGNMMGNPKVYHADEFLRDQQEFDLAGFHIRCLHTPGHTAGGCCYYIAREDVLFSGDSLFCGSIGRTDFPGGSAATLVNSVREKLMVLPENTLVLPGHDARTTIEQERMYNPFL